MVSGRRENGVANSDLGSFDLSTAVQELVQGYKNKGRALPGNQAVIRQFSNNAIRERALPDEYQLRVDTVHGRDATHPSRTISL